MEKENGEFIISRRDYLCDQYVHAWFFLVISTWIPHKTFFEFAYLEDSIHKTQKTNYHNNRQQKKENSVIITALLNENGSRKYKFVGTEWLNPQGDSVTHLSARGA